MILLTYPTLDQLGQLGLPGMAQAFAELEAADDAAALTHADWLALLLDRELTIVAISGWPPGCAMPDCASRPPLRTSIIEPRAASTAHCSKSSPMATGSTHTTI